MARSGGHDEILQAEHMGLLPDGPPTVVGFGGRGLVQVGDPEKSGELVRRGPSRVPLDCAAVVQRQLGVPAPPEVAVGAEEFGTGGGAAAVAEDGPGCAACGAERGAQVAGADRVGGVHVAVAQQAEPGAVGPAVHHRLWAAAVVAGYRVARELLLHDRQLWILALVLTHVEWSLVEKMDWWNGRCWKRAW